MREHFIVDNSTTPDWEVIPLGPVDKEGRKVSLSTATLFADSGMELTVRRYEYLLGAGVWRACCDEGVARVDDMHLIRPDTFGALRLTYDLRMQAAKSLREDSTLCLLWAMLMDSYSRWRTTWDVFNETGESYDL